MVRGVLLRPLVNRGEDRLIYVRSAVLIVAAIAASLMPAARASRVDVLQALRSE